MNGSPTTQHALTVDLEDWQQNMRRYILGDEVHPSRDVLGETERILDLLDAYRVRATFFVLGSVAAAYPHLVREVASRGHEIGSHTYDHQLVYRTTEEAFRQDIARSRRQLQDLTGQPVLGFRAPWFSVGALDHWCFRILAEEGFAYDSSVFPCTGGRYGIRDAPLHPFTIETAAGPIREFPLSTWRVGPWRLPAAGGSWLRLVPWSVTGRALHDAERERRPAVIYLHPAEFHRGWLYLPGVPWHRHLRPGAARRALLRYMLHNFRTAAVERQVRAMLARHAFGRLCDLA